MKVESPPKNPTIGHPCHPLLKHQETSGSASPLPPSVPKNPIAGNGTASALDAHTLTRPGRRLTEESAGAVRGPRAWHGGMHEISGSFWGVVTRVVSMRLPQVTLLHGGQRKLPVVSIVVPCLV